MDEGLSGTRALSVPDRPRLSLACPACGGPLRIEPPGARCEGCGLGYPEREGILDLTRGRSGPPGYDPHYFGTLPQIEDSHFWFVARRQVILEGLRSGVDDLAERALFDVGCGSGGLLAFLEASGLAVAGACDAYPLGLALARRRVRAPLGPGQRLIGLFDVLEHIDDDRGTLRFLWSVLEPGGVLVLTVPGHPFLFDEMDELARHRRRYTRRELGDKLRAAGFEVRFLSHFMALLVPLLVVLRGVGRLLPGRVAGARRRRDSELRVVPVVNGLLRRLLRLERLWLRVGRLPFGSSIIAQAHRPPLP
jgi:SAM-dependent methyltransferase